jgi:broad specificity phosphatase PhoE
MDVPLSEHGRSQLDGIAASLPSRPRIVTSDLSRCLLLAEVLSKRLGAQIGLDIRWREQSFGEWEGKTWDDVDGRDYLDSWTTATPPGGESIREVLLRVAAALGDVDDRTIVVSHAGPIRCALSITGSMSLEEAFDTEIPFGSWRFA